MQKKIGLVLLAAILAVAGSAAAQDGRFFIGAMAPQIKFGGSDFNGDNFFDLDSQFVFIPKVQTAWGWGLLLGYGEDDFDCDFYYMQSKHSASILTIPESADFSAIGINARWYVSDPGMIRVFLNAAFDFSSLTVTHAAVQSYEPYQEGNARFRGLGICGGCGLSITAFERLTFFAGMEFRWNIMGQVKGYEGEYQNTEDLDSTGFGFRLGTVFRF